MSKNKHLLHSIHHLLIGCLLVLKGFDKYSHHPYIGGLILFFGFIIIGYFIYSQVKKKEKKILEIIVHVFEAVVALFTTYIFFEEGKIYLPWFSLLAAIGFFIGAYVSYKKWSR